MKEKNVVLVILVVLALLILLVTTVLYEERRIEEEKQLAKAISIVKNGENSKINIPIVTEKELETNDNIIGVLEIPKINLIAPIKEGTSQEILKTSIGHFLESSFWNGNVALASHNRSLYKHYFERINELKLNDEIIYKTKMGERKYCVYDSKEIDSTDWSVIANTKENIITLITCIKNNQEKRLCVRAKEVTNTSNTKENIEKQNEESIKNVDEKTEAEENTKQEETNERIRENRSNEEANKTGKTENIEPEVTEIKLDFSKYDRYYPAINGGYTCFGKSSEGIAKLKKLIEEAIQEFEYTNVKIIEDRNITKERYFTANKTNVQNMIYGSEGFAIHYYAETEYVLDAEGNESAFQTRAYIQIKGQ